ncbi:MAG TPA: Crp/Fnr family transcriptional regulator [Gammaproteobacteria bacterium]|nr:Crp/Fnr family transcriptional regulator [Gammaproteobacteria bacterium]
MIDSRRISQHIRQLPLFTELTPDIVDLFVERVRVVELTRNEIVFHQGQTVQSLFSVISGQIKLVVTAPTGAEKVVEIAGSGRSFGEALMFLERPSPVSAQAVVKTELLEISSELIFSAIDESPRICRALLAGLSYRLHHLVSDLETCCLQTSTERVARFIVEELGADPRKESFTFPANKNLIASQLNLAPESFSRILHHLSEKKIIEVHGRELTVLDKKRLVLES